MNYKSEFMGPNPPSFQDLTFNTHAHQLSLIQSNWTTGTCQHIPYSLLPSTLNLSFPLLRISSPTYLLTNSYSSRLLEYFPNIPLCTQAPEHTFVIAQERYIEAHCLLIASQSPIISSSLTVAPDTY